MKIQNNPTSKTFLYMCMTPCLNSSKYLFRPLISYLYFFLPHPDKFEVVRYLFEGQCREFCPEGFFHSKHRCEPCATECTICTAADHCLHCSSGYEIRNGRCVPLKCSPGKKWEKDPSMLGDTTVTIIALWPWMRWTLSSNSKTMQLCYWIKQELVIMSV